MRRSALVSLLLLLAVVSGSAWPALQSVKLEIQIRGQWGQHALEWAPVLTTPLDSECVFSCGKSKTEHDVSGKIRVSHITASESCLIDVDLSCSPSGEEPAQSHCTYTGKLGQTSQIDIEVDESHHLIAEILPSRI